MVYDCQSPTTSKKLLIVLLQELNISEPETKQSTRVGQYLTLINNL